MNWAAQLGDDRRLRRRAKQEQLPLPLANSGVDRDAQPSAGLNAALGEAFTSQKLAKKPPPVLPPHLRAAPKVPLSPAVTAPGPSLVSPALTSPPARATAAALVPDMVPVSLDPHDPMVAKEDRIVEQLVEASTVAASSSHQQGASTVAASSRNEHQKLLDRLLQSEPQEILERLLKNDEPKPDSDAQSTSAPSQARKRWQRVSNQSEAHGCQVVAIEAYDAQGNDHLSLQRGDRFILTGLWDNGFYPGKNVETGECGWLPAYAVEQITQRTEGPIINRIATRDPLGDFTSCGEVQAERKASHISQASSCQVFDMAADSSEADLGETCEDEAEYNEEVDNEYRQDENGEGEAEEGKANEEVCKDQKQKDKVEKEELEEEEEKDEEEELEDEGKYHQDWEKNQQQEQHQMQQLPGVEDEKKHEEVPQQQQQKNSDFALFSRPEESAAARLHGEFLDSYTCPRSHLVWFYHEATGNSYFLDNSWERYQYETGKYWWWRESTGEWFYERQP